MPEFLVGRQRFKLIIFIRATDAIAIQAPYGMCIYIRELAQCFVQGEG